MRDSRMIIGEKLLQAIPALIRAAERSPELNSGHAAALSFQDRAEVALLVRHVADVVGQSVAERLGLSLPRLRARQELATFSILSQAIVIDIWKIVTRHTLRLVDQVARTVDYDQVMFFAGIASECGHRPMAEALDIYQSRSALTLPAGGLDERQALAAQLIHGELADAVAGQANARVAPNYVTAVIDVGGSRLQRQPMAAGQLLPAAGPAIYPYDALTLRDGDREILLLPAMRAVSRAQARHLTQHVLQRHRGVIWRIAVAPSNDKTDVPAAVDEARTVLRIVGSLGYKPGIYQLDDVAIEFSLLRSPDVARLLALRLTPLTGRSGSVLFDTARRYFEKSQDRKETASALRIHPNTLDYRLRRIRDLTGLSPMLPHDIQILGAALAAWQLLDMDQAKADPAGIDLAS
jgi:hypothetical protein